MVLENTIITEYKNCSFHIYVYIRVYTRKYNVSSERKKERKHNYIFDLTHLEKLLRNAKLFVLERKSYIWEKGNTCELKKNIQNLRQKKRRI